MGILARVTQKIFGANGDSSEFGKIGSEAAGSPATTKDLVLIQSLSQFLGGLYAITDDANEPPRIQDINALYFLITSQLAYLFQAGIPEWDTGTNYYTGSLCQVAGIIYRAITGTSETPNIDNDPSANPDDWLDLDVYYRNASNLNAGTIGLDRIPDTLTGKNATTADHATSADSAGSAASAGHASSSDTADTASEATHATNADHASAADTADSATTSGHASSADTASSAENSAKLAGAAPGALGLSVVGAAAYSATSDLLIMPPIAGAPTERTAGGSSVLVKTFTMQAPGSVAVTWEQKGNNSTISLQVNDVEKDNVHLDTGTYTPEGYLLTGLSAGDVIKLYLIAAGGGTAYIHQVYLRAFVPGPNVNQD